MQEITLNCGFGKIKGICWGKGNKDKILALHGWLDNAASFYQLAPKLAAKGYEVIAIDFAGHGHSDHRAEGHFTHFIDFILDIQDVINELQWQKPILLGHSMGAAMAQMYTATCPDKIEKLIMIENIGPVPPYEKGSAASNLKQALSQWKNHTTEHKNYYPDIESALEARLRVTPMKAEILKPMVERGLKKTQKGYHWRTDKRLRLRSLFRFTEEMVQDMLMAEKPTTQLILANPYTYALSYPSVDERIEKLKPKQYNKLKGHHHLHMDKAQEIFDVIMPFLKP
jgi:pimeloyl-ACP methyl ester carboxylesterase